MSLHKLFTALFLFCAPVMVAENGPLLDANAKAAIAERVNSGAYPTIVVGVIDGDHQEVVTFGHANEHTIYESAPSHCHVESTVVDRAVR